MVVMSKAMTAVVVWVAAVVVWVVEMVVVVWVVALVALVEEMEMVEEVLVEEVEVVGERKYGSFPVRRWQRAWRRHSTT